jgi:hypothetical protein
VRYPERLSRYDDEQQVWLLGLFLGKGMDSSLLSLHTDSGGTRSPLSNGHMRIFARG